VKMRVKKPLTKKHKLLISVAKTKNYLTFNGETLSWKQWAKKLGITYGAFKYRVLNKWPLEKICSKIKWERNIT